MRTCLLTDFFRHRMDVEDAIVPRRDDGTKIEKYDLSLKLADAVHWPLGRAQHEPGQNVFLFDSPNADPDLLAGLRCFDLIFGLAVERGNSDLLPIRHQLILHKVLNDTIQHGLTRYVPSFLMTPASICHWSA